MNEKKMAKACLLMSQAYALMAEAYGADATASVHEATKEQEEVNAVRDGKVTDIAQGRKSKNAARESEDKESSPRSGKESKEVIAARKELAEIEDLENAARPEIVPIAKALGLETKGVITEELIAKLQAIKDGSGSKPSAAAADEDDEEPVKPVKGKAPAAAEEDDDDEATAAEPDLKTMKKQFKMWAKANKTDLEKQFGPFFDDTDDAEDVPKAKRAYYRLHLTLADEETLREQWNDNVKELIGTKAWKKVEELSA